MIDIEVIGNDLVLVYKSEYDHDWLEERLHMKPKISHIFRVDASLLLKKSATSDIDEVPDYYFKIGELLDGYYKINKSVFDFQNDFFLHNSLNIRKQSFIVDPYLSILNQIDRMVQQDVFIGGPKEDILPGEEFERLIKAFPGAYEITLYRQAKTSSILKNYFDNVKDWEERYNSHINKKTPTYNSSLRKMFKEADILKYESLNEKLKVMLDNEIKYSEKQWQKEILQIILLLFPKYISAFPEVVFEDIYNKKKRRLDYGLIDFMGNLDIVEIKLPFDHSIVSVNQYRDNHIPNRDLSGTIMQIEKYLFYLNKLGSYGEKKLTKKYKNKLPEGLDIKIINPRGIIIMGRDNTLTPQQIADFEIIKRKYRNIMDIFTYDDLLRRLEVILDQLKKL